MHTTAVLVVVVDVSSIWVHINIIIEFLHIDLNVAPEGTLLPLAAGDLNYPGFQVGVTFFGNDCSDGILFNSPDNTNGVTKQKDRFPVHGAPDDVKAVSGCEPLEQFLAVYPIRVSECDAGHLGLDGLHGHLLSLSDGFAQDVTEATHVPIFTCAGEYEVLPIHAQIRPAQLGSASRMQAFVRG